MIVLSHPVLTFISDITSSKSISTIKFQIHEGSMAISIVIGILYYAALQSEHASKVVAHFNRAKVKVFTRFFVGELARQTKPKPDFPLCRTMVTRRCPETDLHKSRHACSWKEGAFAYHVKTAIIFQCVAY